MKKIFLFIALLATLIPAIFTIHVVGGWQNWQGVLPRGTTDSLYYYARIHEVADGHPLVGNPYVYEYRSALAPAFFLPDIVSSLPVLLGVPFNVAIMLNVFVWSFIFLVLSFTLLRLLLIPIGWASLWSVLMYVGSYSFMLRPTVMQIVYPVFLAFLIALLKFLHEPFERKRIVWLALAAASTFYVYTYLSYIVLLIFTFLFFRFLFAKRYQELKALIISGVYTALALIPFGIYTLMQMKSPYYFETLSRIGLVYTHIPAIEAIFYGRWVLIGLTVLGLLWKFFPKKKEHDSERKVFWLATGAALFVGLFLNMITGVELQLAIHIGRLVLLWMTMMLGALLYDWYSSRLPAPKAADDGGQARNLEVGKTKYVIVAIFLTILSVGVARNLSRGLSFFEFNNRGIDIADLQNYSAPLKWLEENVSEQSVIWANESVGEYVPIITRHYPLFFHGAVLHSISAKELEERFLLSRSLSLLTIEDLKRDFGLYSGRKPLKEEEYFKEMAERFNTIRKNQAAFLQQFNVRYLIIDRAHDNLESLSLDEALYDDGRFVVLLLPLRFKD